jgi:hypothetical protein
MPTPPTHRQPGGAVRRATTSSTPGTARRRTSDVPRTGLTCRGVRPVEMDSRSLLLGVPDRARVPLPNHAVDADLLWRGPAEDERPRAG